MFMIISTIHLAIIINVQYLGLQVKYTLLFSGLNKNLNFLDRFFAKYSNIKYMFEFPCIISQYTGCTRRKGQYSGRL
jgi:hypothetical protein